MAIRMCLCGVCVCLCACPIARAWLTDDGPTRCKYVPPKYLSMYFIIELIAQRQNTAGTHVCASENCHLLLNFLHFSVITLCLNTLQSRELSSKRASHRLMMLCTWHFTFDTTLFNMTCHHPPPRAWQECDEIADCNMFTFLDLVQFLVALCYGLHNNTASFAVGKAVILRKGIKVSFRYPTVMPPCRHPFTCCSALVAVFSFCFFTPSPSLRTVFNVNVKCALRALVLMFYCSPCLSTVLHFLFSFEPVTFCLLNGRLTDHLLMCACPAINDR